MAHSHASKGCNVGIYLGKRLEEIGCKDYFAVPGDYNLVLLDMLLLNKNLKMIGCCNELNAGYAADGYARAVGVGCVVVTFTVGGLSVINAIAGAYSADLPIIVISGGPNSNDYATNRVLHHTIGLADRDQQFRVFREVTVEAVVINHAVDAPRLIDKAISAALLRKKPVYIEISCNLSTAASPDPVPFHIRPIQSSNPSGLTEAVNAVASLWSAAAKATIVVGYKVRVSAACDALVKLADAAGGGVAVMPDAKGMFPEMHPMFMGTYWGNVSSYGVCETVEACDTYIFVGPVFNDYTTVGYSTLIKKEKMVEVQADRVKLPNGQEFGCVYMAEFLEKLAETITPNPGSMKTFKRYNRLLTDALSDAPDSPLQTKQLRHAIQQMLTSSFAVIAETGDSWFQGQKFNLPDGCKYEFQMQYGSIGWAVGAVLGQAVAYSRTADKKRVVALIGDGSFQMTAQEVSTMIRYRQDPIIFLLNNRGYTIEVEIHDGPYNNIQDWDYKALIDAFAHGDPNTFTVRIHNKLELDAAIEKAQAHKGLVFIECILDRDDCSKELLEWGSRVASANGRPVRAHEDF
mmetsp:Transcript_10882/g.19058  ORF Transcript_10882/g.19058 Transcript_10882/m.19058 type:complete len:575 (+) Transcript_10882:67-1791(+)|eukprot:CAMPEP_0196657140 /NCGR_PEP_ID=MMETSP1086-20130531/22028_1 /TAXON_ID=77921 /ORGANISM="Cyanoptyche  gloeocystis , Strain SAG4.97" /LENGTH=574 /DNA_ID=CAMNT_0041990165 /DNA_START=63 /DNA_END=1787 /DNA_ORIENTATION=+